MALDNDRNRVLTSLRDRSRGVDCTALIQILGLDKIAVERHLLYCVDYALATWKRQRDGLGLATITDLGREYLGRQNL